MPCKKLLSLFFISPLLVGCQKVFPEHLPAEQSQLSQPVFIGGMLHPFDHIFGPPLDLLKQVESWTEKQEECKDKLNVSQLMAELLGVHSGGTSRVSACSLPVPFPRVARSGCPVRKTTVSMG